MAGFHLGARAGRLAAAALLADYTLTAAVGISAGVGALVSAVPSLLPHTAYRRFGSVSGYHNFVADLEQLNAWHEVDF